MDKSLKEVKAFLTKPPTLANRESEPTFSANTEPTQSYIEDQILEADELLERGNIEEAESLYEKALEYYNQPHQIYKTNDHPKGVIETHLKIALVSWRKGHHDIGVYFRIYGDALSAPMPARFS